MHSGPWQAVTDGGHEAVLVAPEAGTVQLFNHLDKADTKQADHAVADAPVEDYDALVIPGGVANPDALRMHQQAVELVREFVASGKPVAVICHGPWLLVEADVVSGRRLRLGADRRSPWDVALSRPCHPRGPR